MRKYTLFAFALLLALSVTASAQQKEAPASDKEKAERIRAEGFKKVVAPMIAEGEQRKVIIRDLLDTCAKCRAYDDDHAAAPDNSDRKRGWAVLSSNCHEVLDAKLARTPLDTLAPYLDVIKGVDPQIAKRVAVWVLYEAYEYGIERAKNITDKP